MIIERIYDRKLAQASYFVGCAATGEAIVIDPLRDIAPYQELATLHGMTISSVAETHIHADYLSGTRELSAATGARMILSDEGDADWKYQFAHDPLVTLVKDGDSFKIGNLRFDVVHTPGHTPEHIALVLTDTPAGDVPHSAFTGDFLFVGDVGRPDLLERAANLAGTMEQGARVLFQSIQRTVSWSDSLLIWPAHGAGSACGKSLGGSPVSSMGYERATNWAFQIHSEQEFVDAVLAGQPEPPVYFAEMKRLNKVGPTVLGDQRPLANLRSAIGFHVDVRDADTIRGKMFDGSLVIPRGNGFTNWAGWLLAYNQPVTLIAENQAMADQAVRDLQTIGLDIAAGWIKPDDVAASCGPMAGTSWDQVRETDFVLDVRGINEWSAGHHPRAVHIPLGNLTARVGELPRDQRIVVHCQGGGRSPIAMSILRRGGFTDIAEIPAGFKPYVGPSAVGQL